MRSKLSKEDQLEIFQLCLKGEPQKDIAAKFDISQAWVSNIYHKTIKRIDQEFAVSAALEFVQEYHKSYQYVQMKQRELEVLLKDADPRDRHKIIMDQVALQQILLNTCAQGKFIQAVQEWGYSQGQEKPPMLEGDSKE